MYQSFKVLRFFSFLFFSVSSLISLNGQFRQLQIEGTGDQYAIIQTTDVGNSSAGIELLRSGAFGGTDWRMVNQGGLLLFENTTDNFEQDANQWLEINQSGNAFFEGGVAVGTDTRLARLSIEDNGFQLHLGNSDDVTSDWFIGASRPGWQVGADRLVFSPTTNSSDAMMIMDKEDDIIQMRDNRVTMVADPINERDAVNLRTLKSAGNPMEIVLGSTQSQTLPACATTCRTLSTGGHTDWRLPEMSEAVQFLGFTSSSASAWTSTVEPETIDLNNVDITSYRAINFASGRIRILNPISNSVQCYCVR